MGPDNMMSILHFDKKFFLLFLILFGLETFIALYIHDQLVRPLLGDFLVIILVFALFGTFTQGSVTVLTLSALAFCYLVEYGQYHHILHQVALDRYRWLRIAFGTSFDMRDLLAYTLGAVAILSWANTVGMGRK
jgi:hypothetical protein